MTKLIVENMKRVVFKTFDNVVFIIVFFLVDEWREDPNTTISGPSLACQGNTIEMAFRWRANDGPTSNAGLVALRFSGDPDQYC